MLLMQIRSEKCRHSGPLSVLISSCIIKIVRTGDVSNTVSSFPFFVFRLLFALRWILFCIFLHLTIFPGNGLVVQQGCGVSFVASCNAFMQVAHPQPETHKCCLHLKSVDTALEC